MLKLLSSTAFALTIFASANAMALPQETYEKLDIFAQVLDKIRTSYVEEVTQTEVIENAINGMLTSLDPHSAYLNKEAMKEMKETTSGEFGGLGIEVTMDKGFVKVVSPIEDTPAYEAGVQAGDLITEIDGENVQGMSLSDAVDKMRGKVDTKIEIKIFRESEKRSIDITIIRAIIKVKPVKAHLEENGIGYIRLTTFNDNTYNTMKTKLAEITKENGSALKAIVLDLRNNPGGLLTQAIAVADGFLEAGEIVSTRGRIEGQDSRYNARKGDLVNGVPIVVLINGGTASASEIVAGALQDHKRAIIVGTKSFGKGSVQTIMGLSGDTGMKLTTALYYTPSGKSIQAKGIEPDVEIKLAKIEEIDTADYPTEASLKGHIEVGTKTDAVKKQEAEMTAAEKAEAEQLDKRKKDYQLQRALDIAQALALWGQLPAVK